MRERERERERLVIGTERERERGHNKTIQTTRKETNLERERSGG